MEKSMHYTLLQAALAGAVEASSKILEVYRQSFSPNYKADGSPVTLADLRSNAVLEKHLGQTRLPVLTEESTHAPYEERSHWQQFWCVDPLDGTKEFIRHNDEFAICIALIEDRQPVLGVIASPIEQKILVGGREVPAAIVPFDCITDLDKWQFIEPKSVPNSPLVIAGSRTPYSGASLAFINELKKKYGDLDFIRKGSALKFFDLALGKADLYVRFAPTMEWDIAAGQAIVESLGGTVTHAETGVPLHYNKASLFNPHFVATMPALLQSGNT